MYITRKYEITKHLICFTHDKFMYLSQLLIILYSKIICNDNLNVILTFNEMFNIYYKLNLIYMYKIAIHVLFFHTFTDCL